MLNTIDVLGIYISIPMSIHMCTAWLSTSDNRLEWEYIGQTIIDY